MILVVVITAVAAAAALAFVTAVALGVRQANPAGLASPPERGLGRFAARVLGLYVRGHQPAQAAGQEISYERAAL